MTKQAVMNALLLRTLRGAETVSLDVFDTAVLRALAQPTDLFLLMQPEVRRVLGRDDLGFHSVRQQAERTAHERARQTRGAMEATMAEIYEVIRETVNADPDLIAKITQMEVDAERAICRQNPFIFGVYQWCLQNGKRVVCMSDTYLPERVIADILQACGYREYAGLFVSSAVGKTKAGGELYAEALARLGGQPADWLHIGANIPSDVMKPQERGLTTWHYARCVDEFMRDPQTAGVWVRAEGPLQSPGWFAFSERDGQSKTEESRSENAIHQRSDLAASSIGVDCSPGASVALGLLANRLAQMRPQPTGRQHDGFSWQDFGYSTAGPLFVGFTEWLIEQSARHQLQSLCFLARDGLIMKQVYEALAPLTGSMLDTHYLFASRRAMNLAAIEEVDDEHVMRFLIGGTSVLEAAQFIQRLGMDWRPYADVLRACGFRSPQQKVKTGRDYACLHRLFLALAKPICERAREERAVVLDYLVSSGLCDSRRVGLVDIGWHGSMQRAIMDMLRANGIEVAITGLYVGTYEHAAALSKLGYPHEGYLFSQGQPRANVDLVLTCCEIVELLFSATEGSVTEIRRDAGGGFVAIRDSSDLEPHRVEGIRQLQEGAMEFVGDYARLRKRFPQLRLPQAAAVAQLKRVLLHPTRAEAQWLGDIPHGEGFGDVHTRRLIAHPPGMLLMVTRPRKFREQIKQAYWRIGCEVRMSAFRLALGRRLGVMPKRPSALSREPG